MKMNLMESKERTLPAMPAARRNPLQILYGKPGLLLFILILAAVTIMVLRSAVKQGANALADNYIASYSTEKDATYQAWYQNYFDKAEAANHVANRVSIQIGNIRETAKLEVLNVSDVEFIVNRKNNSANITSWLEVPGEGIYVVDFNAAEFIVDNERAHVLVRLPYPELEHIHIDYANVEKIFFKDDSILGGLKDTLFGGSGNYQEGEALAREQLDQADLLIQREFASNQRFFLNAQEAARTTTEGLIRQLNPDVEDLRVDVEFY